MHPTESYLASLSSGSLPAQRSVLRLVAGLLPRGKSLDDPTTLAYGDLMAVRSALAETKSPKYANKCIGVMRAIVTESWRMGLIDGDTRDRLRDIKDIRGERVPPGRHVLPDEVRAMIGTCDDSMIGARDAAILSVLYLTGIRREEVTALDVGDYDPANRTLRVMGKGNKERLQPVVGRAVDDLDRWVAMRGDSPGPMFCRVRRWAKADTCDRLSLPALHKIVKSRASKAGVHDLGVHDFRRSYVSNLLDKGHDLSTVSKLAGHSKPQTTMLYDRRGDAVRRAAAETLEL